MTDTTETITYAHTNPIIRAAWTLAGAGTNASAALQAAHAEGTPLKTLRLQFIAGWMGQRLAGSGKCAESHIAHAVTLMGALSAEAKSKSEDAPRRTPAQDALYASARKAWSRALADAGIETDDARGGANNGKKSKSDVPESPEHASVVPNYTNPKDGLAYLAHAMATLNAFCAKHPEATTAEAVLAIKGCKATIDQCVADWAKTL